jgi:hypothetical protein
MKISTSVFSVIFASLSTVSAFAAPSSVYTSVDPKDCVELSSSEYEANPEIDYFTSVCKGLPGYSISFDGGDARSWLKIRYNGSEPSSLAEGSGESVGQFPNVSSAKVEWRGNTVNGKFVPYAVIHRISGQDPEKIDKQLSALVVTKISTNGTCQQAMIKSSKTMNADARKAADASQGNAGCKIEAFPTAAAN